MSFDYDFPYTPFTDEVMREFARIDAESGRPSMSPVSIHDLMTFDAAVHRGVHSGGPRMQPPVMGGTSLGSPGECMHQL